LFSDINRPDDTKSLEKCGDEQNEASASEKQTIIKELETSVHSSLDPVQTEA